MPKRPCAIALTPDESTILCGDKFGDVYALPLLGKPAPLECIDGRESTQKAQLAPKPFTPTANTKTVHSKRNLEALKNQERMASTRREKEAPGFEHKLLLGHVSLLTDLISTSLSLGNSPTERSRSYILTTDRDEHIRVSRGLPQTHIIEGYCLGHATFISKLCIPEGHERHLISGGGDDYIYLWNWVSQDLLQKLDLKTIVQELRSSLAHMEKVANDFHQTDKEESENSHPIATENIVVSGIWTYRSETQGTQVFVACEAYVKPPHIPTSRY